jgi:hypothetical protein
MAQGNSQLKKGQKTMANSAPVVIASDQTPVPVVITQGVTLGTQDGTPVSFQVTDGAGNPIDSKNGGLKVSVENQLQDTDGGQPTTGLFKDVRFLIGSASVTNPIDTSLYKNVSVHITSQGTSSTVTFQSSNDGKNWVSTFLTLATTTAIPVVSTATTGLYNGPVYGKFFRLSISGITALLTEGVMHFSATPVAQQNVNVVPSATNLPTNITQINSVAITPPNTLNSTGTGIVPAGEMAQLNEGTFTANNAVPLTFPTKTTEALFSALRTSPNRNLYNTIRDGQGNERGVAVTPDFKMTVKDAEGYGINEQNNLVLLQILDAINNLPTKQNQLDSQYSRTVAVQGTVVENIVTATLTVTASTALTTLFTPLLNQKAHLRSIVITNTSASTVCRVDLSDGVKTYTFNTVGGTPSSGISGSGSIIYPASMAGSAWTITCGTSTTDIRVNATFELA